MMLRMLRMLTLLTRLETLVGYIPVVGYIQARDIDSNRFFKILIPGLRFYEIQFPGFRPCKIQIRGARLEIISRPPAPC